MTTGRRGRPSSYRPEFQEQAFKLCLLGATDTSLADFFGVSEQTINKWKQDFPEFIEALKDGKDRADANVSNSLYRRALGYKHKAVKIFMPAGATKPVYADYEEIYPPDTTACIFWLKNRQKKYWRDQQPVSEEAEEGIIIKGGLPTPPKA